MFVLRLLFNYENIFLRNARNNDKIYKAKY